MGLASPCKDLSHSDDGPRRGKSRGLGQGQWGGNDDEDDILLPDSACPDAVPEVVASLLLPVLGPPLLTLLPAPPRLLL
jgi:hypothetical protein